MKFIRDKWNSIRLSRKLAVVLFVQLWLWPQMFTLDVPPNIAVPLFITALCAFLFNLFNMINAIEGKQ